MRLLINGDQSGSALATCWDFWLCKSHLPDTTDREDGRRMNKNRSADRQRRADMWSLREMLCLGEVLQCGTSQHIHIKHQEDFYSNSVPSSLSFLSVSLRHCKSFCNHSLTATFCFPVISFSFYLGWKETDKCFSIYSEVEVLLLCRNFRRSGQNFWCKNWQVKVKQCCDKAKPSDISLDQLIDSWKSLQQKKHLLNKHIFPSSL